MQAVRSSREAAHYELGRQSALVHARLLAAGYLHVSAATVSRGLCLPADEAADVASCTLPSKESDAKADAARSGLSELLYYEQSLAMARMLRNGGPAVAASPSSPSKGDAAAVPSASFAWAGGGMRDPALPWSPPRGWYPQYVEGSEAQRTGVAVHGHGPDLTSGVVKPAGAEGRVGEEVRGEEEGGEGEEEIDSEADFADWRRSGYCEHIDDDDDDDDYDEDDDDESAYRTGYDNAIEGLDDFDEYLAMLRQEGACTGDEDDESRSDETEGNGAFYGYYATPDGMVDGPKSLFAMTMGPNHYIEGVAAAARPAFPSATRLPSSAGAVPLSNGHSTSSGRPRSLVGVNRDAAGAHDAEIDALRSAALSLGNSGSGAKAGESEAEAGATAGVPATAVVEAPGAKELVLGAAMVAVERVSAAAVAATATTTVAGVTVEGGRDAKELVMGAALAAVERVSAAAAAGLGVLEAEEGVQTHEVGVGVEDGLEAEQAEEWDEVGHTVTLLDAAEYAEWPTSYS
jgi:hypothetical protein